MSDLAERLKKIRNFEKKAGKTFFSQKNIAYKNWNISGKQPIVIGIWLLLMLR